LKLNAKYYLVDKRLPSEDNLIMRKNAKLPKTLGKKIQKIRKSIGFTQEELAEKIGISRAYMGFIEQGRYSASLEVLEKIAKALRIKMSDLF
jgi:DNA-binding XRE family transcriptional regulator